MAEVRRGKEAVWSLGLMSGTSLDGIDSALLQTDGERIFKHGPCRTIAYQAEIRRALRRLVDGERDEIDDVERALTEAHVTAVHDLLVEENIGVETVRVVGFHGHTIWHDPSNRITRQIGDGKLLARRLAIDVVNDFRAADMAAGGQGAPLAPLYHDALARCAGEPLALPVVVLNLGGVANITWIGEDGKLAAFDTGPGCAMIDDWLLARTGSAFDRGGSLAATGRVNAAALAALMRHPYFSLLPPKSLDRNEFDSNPLAKLSDEDGAATLVAFTAQAVTEGLQKCPESPRRLFVTGGGRHNLTLMAALAEFARVPVDPVEYLGWRGDVLEAEAFAYLAVRSLFGMALSVPATTGTDRPRTGGILHRAK